MTSILGKINPDDFIQNYWQQKPLLIRNAFPTLPASLAPNELAGLALEPDVRARIVLEKDGLFPWECRYGPFVDEVFTQMPATHWTLLVQDIEKLLPEFSALLDHFLFIPRWRIDDLMVSYAAPGGSVGPHTDQYDVFLLQGIGSREWHIQQHHVAANDLVDDIELQILNNFAPEETWILEQGDMLYLPPGVAHHGVAVDECMTYSIGFRAPSRAELLQGLHEAVINRPEVNQHIRDQFTHRPSNPGEIDQDSLEQIRLFMLETLDDKDLAYGAICSLLSEGSPYFPEAPDTVGLSAFRKLYAHHRLIHIHPAIRMLYLKTKSGLEWYVDGCPYPVKTEQADVVSSLVDNYRLDIDGIETILRDPLLSDVLLTIYNNGGFIFDGHD